VELEASAPDATQHDAAHTAPEPEAAKVEEHEETAPETAAPASDDFAAALHSFETETEEAVGDDTSSKAA